MGCWLCSNLPIPPPPSAAAHHPPPAAGPAMADPSLHLRLQSLLQDLEAAGPDCAQGEAAEMLELSLRLA